MTIAYTSGSAVKVRLGLGTADTTDDALLSDLAAAANAWVEDYLGRAVGPVSGGTYTFDGEGDSELYIPQGIRALTSVSMILQDGGGTVSVPVADFRLEPVESDRTPGWPAFYVEFKTTTSSGYYTFPDLDQSVTIVGDFGWAAIPAVLTDIATTLAVSKWRARASGGGESMTIGVDGERTYERSLDYEAKRTLKRYMRHPVGIG